MRKYNITINNIPSETEKHIVCRLVEGELWYFADFDDCERAKICASELGDNAIIIED